MRIAEETEQCREWWCLTSPLWMRAGNENMAAAAHHIPSHFVDLEPGDVLFNPPWQWHKITSALLLPCSLID